MFKERYIKDNQLIKPDDDFLVRMKTTVLQEQQKLHIGEYVDYENAQDFSQIEKYHSPDESNSRWGDRAKKWAPFALAAACVALVCGVFWGTGNLEFSKQEGLKINMKSALEDDAEHDVSDSKIKLLHKVIKEEDGIIYQIDSEYECDNVDVSLLEDGGKRLSEEEKDGLIRNILEDDYKEVTSMNEMQSPLCYAICYDAQQYILFAIDEDEICILNVSDIEAVALR